MLYFAYGSNLSVARFLQRLPEAIPVTTARLQGHVLCFHKRGMDGSAKCNALPEAGMLHGAVYQITTAAKSRLDRIEGLGAGYREARVEILVGNTRREHAVTYLATHIDGRLLPFSWYRQHVLEGAREWGLPAEHLRTIEAMPCIEDPDKRRDARERTVHYQT